MPEMYFCTECGRKHRCGKIYKEHLKFKKEKNSEEKEKLLLSLANINREIMYGNYTEKDKKFLIAIKNLLEGNVKKLC